MVKPAPNYLVRARYKLADRDLALKLRNPYEQHRTLWKLFPEASERTFLFRQCNDPALLGRGIGEFLLLTSQLPQSDVFELQCKPYKPALTVGDQLHFSLRAEVLAASAPTASEAPESGKRERGRRIDPVLHALHQVTHDERASVRRRWLYGDEESAEQPLLIRQWLAPKLLRLGFEVELSSSVCSDYQVVKFNADKREIKFSIADFQGRLRVQNALLASEAALTGVGHSKAFGCGLLLLRRAEHEDQ